MLKKAKQKNKVSGNIGESIAYYYVTKILKYKIIQTNYKNKLGELDIIATDGKSIFIIEVKRKNTLVFGFPREEVTSLKQQKIKRCAILFLKENNLYEKVNVQFDVCEILGENVNYIENAF